MLYIQPESRNRENASVAIFPMRERKLLLVTRPLWKKTMKIFEKKKRKDFPSNAPTRIGILRGFRMDFELVRNFERGGR